MRQRGARAASLGLTILVLLPWVYALAIVVSSMAAEIEEFDDALPLVLGSLVQHGAIPTIDFRAFYPPVGPYVTAAAFSLFGRTVIATRILGGGIYLLVLFLLHRLLLRHFQGSAARAMVVLLAAATLGRAVAIPAWPGFGLAMAALLVYLLSREGGALARLTLGLSGALTGLALLYRLNFGGYVALIVAIDLLIEGCPMDRAAWRARQWRTPLFNGAIFGAPLLACVLAICFCVYGNRIVEGIIEFSYTSQKLMAKFRFIDLRWSLRLSGAIVFPAVWFCLRLLSKTGKLSWRYLPAMALGLGSVILAGARGSDASVVPAIILCQLAGVIGLHFFVLPLARLERVFLLFYILQLHYYLTRADHMHLKFLPYSAGLLLILLAPGAMRTGEAGNIIFGRAIELVGCAVLIWAVCWPQSKVSVWNLGHGFKLMTEVCLHLPFEDSERVLAFPTPPAAWTLVYPAADELKALRHLRMVTSKADPIFVGVQDHSRVFFSDLRMYWLSGRPIGVRDFQLEDRTTTEAPVQRGIIHDLDRNHVNWVVIDRKPYEGDEPFIRRAYSGSTLLDEFIVQNFEEESHFGRYAILRRRTGTLASGDQVSPGGVPVSSGDELGTLKR